MALRAFGAGGAAAGAAGGNGVKRENVKRERNGDITDRETSVDNVSDGAAKVLLMLAHAGASSEGKEAQSKVCSWAWEGAHSKSLCGS